MTLSRSNLALVLIPLVALACSDGGGPAGVDDTGDPGPGPGTSPPVATTAQVSMVSAGDGYGETSHGFAPNEVTIVVDGNVTWVNESGFIHNVTFAGTAAAPANIANHSAGSTARTFDAAGTFDYQCTNHPGMNGRVRVVDGD